MSFNICRKIHDANLPVDEILVTMDNLDDEPHVHLDVDDYLVLGPRPDVQDNPADRNKYADLTEQGPIQGNGNGGITSPGAFDPFVTTPTPMTPGSVGPVSTNPYSHDPTTMGGAFFANQTGFQQPVCRGTTRIFIWSR